jgi:hypothetical protein
MARNYRPADDAKAAGKLYPGDRHAAGYGHHHHDKGHAIRNDGDIERGLPSTEGTPIVRNPPDAAAAINKLYSDGRRVYGQPNPDARRDERTPKFGGIAPDQSQPQDRESRTSDHVDTKEAWVRGYGSQSPHPAFDSGPSGSRFDRK